MENNKDFELTEEEHEFLHMMYEETFDFEKSEKEVAFKLNELMEGM